MFMKKPRNRIFDYPSRFYNPETDVKEKQKRKLGFTRQRKYNTKKRSPAVWGIFIILAVYIYLKLSGQI